MRQLALCILDNIFSIDLLLFYLFVCVEPVKLSYAHIIELWKVIQFKLSESVTKISGICR